MYLKTLVDDEPKPNQWKLREEMLPGKEEGEGAKSRTRARQDVRVLKDSRHGSAIGGRGPGRNLSESYADEVGAKSTTEERVAKKTVLSQLGVGAGQILPDSPRQSAIAQKIQ